MNHPIGRFGVLRRRFFPAPLRSLAVRRHQNGGRCWKQRRSPQVPVGPRPRSVQTIYGARRTSAAGSRPTAAGLRPARRPGPARCPGPDRWPFRTSACSRLFSKHFMTSQSSSPRIRANQLLRLSLSQAGQRGLSVLRPQPAEGLGMALPRAPPDRISSSIAPLRVGAAWCRRVASR